MCAVFDNYKVHPVSTSESLREDNSNIYDAIADGLENRTIGLFIKPYGVDHQKVNNPKDGGSNDCLCECEPKISTGYPS
jgi:hypothetical protein